MERITTPESTIRRFASNEEPKDIFRSDLCRLTKRLGVDERIGSGSSGSSGNKKSQANVGLNESFCTHAPPADRIVPAHMRNPSKSLVLNNNSLFFDEHTLQDLYSFALSMPREDIPAFQHSTSQELNDLTIVSQNSTASKFSANSVLNVLSVNAIQVEVDGDSLCQGVLRSPEVPGLLRLEASEETLPSALGEKLKALLDTTDSPCATILLPPYQIDVQELTFVRPANIVGCPGSHLVVHGGPIAIKCGSKDSTNNTVTFTECTLDLNTSRSGVDKPRMLFEVWNGAGLKLVDCMMKTEARSAFLRTSKDNSTAEICIHISPQSEGKLGGQAHLVACSFVNFFTHIVAGKNSRLQVESCGFFKCGNSSILAINPMELSVAGSAFEGCGESAVEIRWVRPSHAETRPMNRKVRIEHNRVNNMKACGVSVCGEKLQSGSASVPESAEISISSNAINKCAGDSILMKNIVMTKEISVVGNRITNGGSNGLSVISVTQFTEAATLQIRDNQISNGKCHGIFVSESSCRISNCSCCNNSLKGIFVSRLRTEDGDKKEWGLVVSNSEIRENVAGGVSLVDTQNTKILIDACKLTKNGEYGFTLNNNESSSSASPNIGTRPESCFVEQYKNENVLIRNGEIHENVKGGILVGSQSLYIDEVSVRDNEHTAIYIDSNKGKIAYSTETIKRKLIIGSVKSKLKEINIYALKGNKAACCGCTIF